MWKIRQKYLLIELMTYLAFRHTQSLLFRVSKDFRSRLISSFKQLKNMLGQNDYEAPNVCSIKLGYCLAKPEKIYIEQDQLKIFQQKLTIPIQLDVTICILENIPQKMKILGKNNGLKQINNVTFSFLTNDKNLTSDQFTKLFSILEIYFQKKKLQIQLFEIDSTSNFFFCIEFLKSISEVRIIQNYGCSYSCNLAFEDLSIPYPNTKFVIDTTHNFNNYLYKNNQIQELLNRQNCTLNLKYLDPEIDLIAIKFEYPKLALDLNIWKIKLEEISFLQGCNKIYGHQLVLNVKDLCNNEISYHKSLRVNYLHFADYKDCLDYKRLSCFKITEGFHLEFNSNLKVINSETTKCKSPQRITLTGLWTDDASRHVIQILNGFYQYENVTELKIQYQQIEKRAAINELCLKIGQFVGLRELTLPLAAIYYGVTQALGNMLSQMKKLVKLRFSLVTKKNIYQINDLVQAMSQYAIEKMQELRELDFEVRQPILMKQISQFQRVKQLIITIMTGDFIHCIIDVHQGFRQK